MLLSCDFILFFAWILRKVKIPESFIESVERMTDSYRWNPVSMNHWIHSAQILNHFLFYYFTDSVVPYWLKVKPTVGALGCWAYDKKPAGIWNLIQNTGWITCKCCGRSMWLWLCDMDFPLRYLVWILFIWIKTTAFKIQSLDSSLISFMTWHCL